MDYITKRRIRRQIIYKFLHLEYETVGTLRDCVRWEEAIRTAGFIVNYYAEE